MNEDLHSPRGETELIYSGKTVFGVGIVTLVIGFVLGWAISQRPTAQPQTAVVAPIAQPTEVVRQVQQSAPESVPVDTAAPSTFILPTPTAIEPETRTVLGDPNAPVTIVEFSDYECPFCARNSQQTFPQLKQNYIDTGRVYYVFKDYPLTGLHPTAPRVHEVGQCVLEISGIETYWEAHDLFFNTQDAWGGNLPQAQQDEVLIELMADLEVPEKALRDCLADGRYVAEVEADMNEGARLGLTGTPTFFINGFPLVGALPFEAFEQAIALAEDGKLAEAIAQSQQAQQPQAQPQTAAANQPTDVPLGDAPAKGSEDAAITIVEYSDYQCPFCGRHFATTMPQLQQYIDSGQVRYVFKDFPIDSIHPQAQKAHESARCAREQGGDLGYWQMHDLLFENQNVWNSITPPNHVPVFKSLAIEAGLDSEAFDECLDNGRYADAVRADRVEGLQFGVSGTPTFFINGQRLVGAQPFEIFEQAIEQLSSESE